ncbi:MAG: hypothetical protein VYE40_14785 [Myxococcota bacterium]|jgi:hypothetical protein|nr:hypothetical protein [Myxococcota bacterium]MEC9442361.1 hypothetical protein [Myxococcota bacterium]
MTVRRYVCTFAIALLVASTWSTHLYSSEALIEDAIFYDMELVSVEVDGVEQTDLSEYEEGIAPRAISQEGGGVLLVTARDEDLKMRIDLLFEAEEGSQ